MIRDRFPRLHPAQVCFVVEDVDEAVDDQGEYPGIRFAFVDTPTGPGMFELLEATGDTPPPGSKEDGSRRSGDSLRPRVAIDRATIVTDDPYTRHLAGGDHGLVHADGVTLESELLAGASVEGEWLEGGEAFGFYSWSGGSGTLQVRRAAA